MKKSFMTKLVKILAVLLSFLMSFNVIYAEGDNTSNPENGKTYTYSTEGKEWVPLGSGTWVMDLNDDNKPDVTLKSSKDSKGNTVWTYTFNVEDDTQEYYVYEAMKNAGLAGVTDEYAATGSDGKKANAVDPGKVDSQTHSYTITNYKWHDSSVGSLKISKSVSNPANMKNPDQEFKFTIRLSVPSSLSGINSTQQTYMKNSVTGTKILGDIPFNNGTAVISLKNGENKIISNIPSYLNYSVTEESLDDYTGNGRNASGEITDSDTPTEVNWTNTSTYTPTYPVDRATNSWKLTKKIENKPKGYKDESYKFLVSMKNLVPYHEYKYQNGSDKEKSFKAADDGNADVEVELKKDETITFKNVPVGSTYQVMEHAGKNYISSYAIADSKNLNKIASASGFNNAKNQELSTAEETVDADEDVTVTFTNDYPSVQSLLIENHWMKLEKGKLVDDDKNVKEFPVTIHFSKIPQGTVIDSSEVGAVTPDMYGEADKTFTMSTDTNNGKNQIHFNDIPAGVQYQITQGKGDEQYPSYRPSYTIKAKDSDGNVIDNSEKSGKGELSSEISTDTETISEGQNHEVKLVNVSSINFGIVKTDDKNDKKLSEATYELLRYEDGKTESIGTQKTNTDGFAGWGSIIDGIYILKETEAPKGYAAGEDIVFKLDNGKVQYCTSADSSKDAGKVADNTIVSTFMKEWEPVEKEYNGTENNSDVLVYHPYPVTEGMLVSLPLTGGIGLYVTLVIAVGLIVTGFLINHKGKAKKTVAMLLLTAMTIGTIGIHTTNVHAEGEETSGNTPGSYNLNVNYIVGSTKVSGATFAITKVADLDVPKQKYTLVGPFTSVEGVNFSNNTADNYNNLTNKFKSVVDNNQSIEKSESTTDNNGLVSFSNISSGMYLLWQTNKEGVAVNYQDAYPTLVSLPNWNGNNWDNSVTVNVKSKSNTITIHGTKVWAENSNDQMPIPDSVTLHLTEKNNKGVFEDVPDVKPVTATAANKWSFSFEPVKKLDESGNQIEYGVREDPVTGYTSSVTGSMENGFTVTNTSETVTVSGKKIWNDSQYAGKTGYQRPTEITVALTGVANGETVETKTQTVTPDQDKNWTYSFADLPKYNKGNLITYTVSETNVKTTTGNHAPSEAGFESTVENKTTDEDKLNNRIVENITNTPKKYEKDDITPVTLTITKKDGKSGKHGVLSGAVFTATKNDNKTAITGTTDMNGQTTLNFTEEGTYILKETKAPEGYQISDHTYTVVVTKSDVDKVDLSVKEEGQNVFTWFYHLFFGKDEKNYTFSYNNHVGVLEVTDDPKTTDIQAEVEWKDNNDQDGLRKDATLHLYKIVGETKSEVPESEKTIQKDATGDDLKTVWKDLPTYEDGKKIDYTVTEDQMTGYTIDVTVNQINDFKFTNTHMPETVTVSGTKTWKDKDYVGKNGYQRPTEITVALTGVAGDDKVPTVTQTVSPDQNGHWEYKFQNLPKYNKGSLIAYTVSETNVKIDEKHQYHDPDEAGYKSYVEYVTTQENKDNNKIVANIVNTPKKDEDNTISATLNITKKDGNTGETLSGAEFTATRNDNNTVITGTTDANGQTSLNFTKEGTYTLKETKAPKGYDISEDIEKGIAVQVKKSGASLIMKTDNGEGIFQWIYHLFFGNDQGTTFKYDENTHTGTLLVNDYKKPTASPDTPAKESPSPSTKPGNSPTPSMKPSESPEPSYLPSESPVPSETPSPSVSPSAVPSESPVPSAKPSEKPSSSPTSETINSVTPAKLVITKKDGNTNQVLSGAEFKAAMKDDSVVVTGRPTDEEGKTSLTFTEAGTYTLTETRAPKGYKVSDEFRKDKGIVVEVYQSDEDQMKVEVKNNETIFTRIYHLFFGNKQKKYTFKYDEKTHSGKLEVKNYPAAPVSPKPTESTKPSVQPSKNPGPVVQPTDHPSPSAGPTEKPEPSDEPTVVPKPYESPEPGYQPSESPVPSGKPSPSVTPSVEPSEKPSSSPSTEPTVVPSNSPEASKKPLPPKKDDDNRNDHPTGNKEEDSSSADTSDHTEIPLMAGILGGSVIVLLSVLLFRKRYN